MANATPTSATKQSIPELLAELRELVVAYAKQETVEPLKNLVNFLKWGIGGAVLMAMSGVLITLGVLRLLQEEAADTFDGNWSVVPYGAAILIATIGAALSFRAIGRPATPGDK